MRTWLIPISRMLMSAILQAGRWLVLCHCFALSTHSRLAEEFTAFLQQNF